MQWDDIYVAGLGVYLPPPATAADAVAAGAYDAEELAANGITSVLVEPELSGPEMAVLAARDAITHSAVNAADIRLVFHSSLWYQGVDMWPAASYVARHAVGDRVVAFDLQQQCNAAVSGMDLAASRLVFERGGAALLTTGDRFCLPGVDRWRTERGLPYGDGGTAMLLSTDGGFAKLLSTSTVADNGLEQVLRGERFHDAPRPGPLDLTSRISHHFANHGGMRAATTRLAEAVKGAIAGALAEAKTDFADLAAAVIPAAGRAKLDWQLSQLVGLREDQTTWSFARTHGHLGAGDQFAGLRHLIAAGVVTPGDRVLMVGSGAGLTATSAVFEILDGLPEPTERTWPQ
ncbi:ketoacyl-ACP synthase III family protein [Actinokineospora iranica]|uniref:3-oxoacyl-[acyl-carrier-protein] synthase-3 n=1 Tax=Actinokineospora iranica TaxID=1271860 RepID=A0A1G6JXF7_9PSEU|nr:ketoacyl-ACP synthase III family protein [Actinokineospora iranica]SDC23085.1 3-oxoacyl-[acyl-carrier-protein] synthase-3 [Actinokineospora iranica]